MLTLRLYQQECVTAFYNYFSIKSGNPIIEVPTAGGKSIIIGALITEICQKWPGQRIALLSHVQELISQNHEKIMLCWENAPAGIYAASLGKRQGHHPIVVAMIQSVYKKAAVLGHRDLLFIDECHLLQSGNMGMYGELIQGLRTINPAMKVCGFSATPYRSDSGLLTEGENPLFTDVIIEIPIKRLLEEGYLTPPISKVSLEQADLDGIKTTAGEFNIKQMAARFDQKAFMNAALDSDMPFFEGRRSIALFCPTVENAEHVAEGMTARGIYCEAIDGEMSKENREDKFKRFRSGELRALASVGVMTTGTDIPNIDCIVLLIATQSPGKYQQIIGRGFRIIYKEGMPIDKLEERIIAIREGQKPNFLILDHGANIERHGTIMHVEKPRVREKGERRKVEKAKVRICDCCRSAWPLEITVCGVCQNILVAERDPTANLDIQASNADILGTLFTRGEAEEWFDIDDVRYYRHQKAGKPDSLRVTYFSGIMSFSEWVHFENDAEFLRSKARNWWNARAPKDNLIGYSVRMTITEALKYAATIQWPKRVLIKKNSNNFYEVLQHEFAREAA